MFKIINECHGLSLLSVTFIALFEYCLVTTSLICRISIVLILRRNWINICILLLYLLVSYLIRNLSLIYLLQVSVLCTFCCRKLNLLLKVSIKSIIIISIVIVYWCLSIDRNICLTSSIRASIRKGLIMRNNWTIRSSI